MLYVYPDSYYHSLLHICLSRLCRLKCEPPCISLHSYVYVWACDNTVHALNLEFIRSTTVFWVILQSHTNGKNLINSLAVSLQAVKYSDRYKEIVLPKTVTLQGKALLSLLSVYVLWLMFTPLTHCSDFNLSKQFDTILYLYSRQSKTLSDFTAHWHLAVIHANCTEFEWLSYTSLNGCCHTFCIFPCLAKRGYMF